MTDEPKTRPAPDVHDLLARIDAGWRDLMHVLGDIPEERLEEPGVAGTWSIKNLMGHIAFWDERAIAAIERTLAGLPDDEVDFQSLNDADHAARLGHTLAEERSAMHQAHAAVVARLEEVAGIDAAALDAAIAPDTYGHYAEHVADIQRWRQREGI
jgi:hypothetical protein